MGNYVFDADALQDAVTRDAERERSKHDMGGDIVPWFVDRTESAVYDFKDNEVPGSNERDRGYWRDVGTMRSYYAAHMDLVAPLPVFNLYNTQWPIYTSYGPQPPAKLVEGDAGEPVKTFNSILSPGVVVTGGDGEHSPCSRPSCWVESGAEVSGSVLLSGVTVGAGAVVRNAIIDKNVVVPPGAEIGVDPERRPARGFVVEDGLTVLAKGQEVPPAVNDISGRSAGRSRRTSSTSPQLVTAYYTGVPDPEDADQRVAFGTSGHRGSGAEDRVQRDHILATTQAICEYRRRAGVRRTAVPRRATPTRCPSRRGPPRWRCSPPTTSPCWSTTATATRRPRRSRTRSSGPTAARTRRAAAWPTASW